MRRSVYAATKTEAEKKLRVALARLEAGQPGLDARTPLRVVVDRWLATAQIAQGISARTLATYEGVLRLHVLPAIGNLPVGEVRPSHVAAVLATMNAAGLSRSYQHMAQKAVAGVYRMAIADELVIRSPTNAVKAPRGGHKERVVPSRRQVLLMIDAAPDHRTRALIAILAYTGLRISEALNLRWSDWDGSSTLRVIKTKGGRPRAVPVPRALRDHLTQWRTVLAAERLASTRWDASVEWLLPSEAGTFWDPHNVRKRFAPIAEATCPGATPHSLRHATATMLLEEGVPIRVVADVLGHSSTRITQDVYSHVTARLTTEAAEALDRALDGSGN